MVDYEHSLAYAIKRTQQAVRHTMDTALAQLSLTTPQFAALTALSADTGLSNAELARRCFVTPQTMHQLIKGLESRNLVERSPHLQHGRIVQVAVTKSGLKLLEKAYKAVGEVEKRMTFHLSALEAKQAADVLARCCVALET